MYIASLSKAFVFNTELIVFLFDILFVDFFVSGLKFQVFHLI
ncbi:hypothetical protein NU08_1101 [Flavobacterium anhuiense]|uniref:Uncharacterized protein n=1 Tax=Flavobacterium anhuiense TaxID=459526 RepID=A0A444W365_9FLAO|nr:hypothetical protein NU08_1101 [Flavobacterium anhuiense]